MVTSSHRFLLYTPFSFTPNIATILAKIIVFYSPNLPLSSPPPGQCCALNVNVLSDAGTLPVAWGLFSVHIICMYKDCRYSMFFPHVFIGLPLGNLLPNILFFQMPLHLSASHVQTILIFSELRPVHQHFTV